MNLQEFITAYSGRAVDFDGFFGFQCMDVVQFYNQNVVGAPRLWVPKDGGAADVWDTYPQEWYDRFARTGNAVPIPGDIVIWGRGLGAYGHIAIVVRADAGGFISFDQNWPLGSSCQQVQHGYSYVLGWIRPKKTKEEYMQFDLIQVRGESAVYMRVWPVGAITGDSILVPIPSAESAAASFGPDWGNRVQQVNSLTGQGVSIVDLFNGSRAEADRAIAVMQNQLDQASIAIRDRDSRITDLNATVTQLQMGIAIPPAPSPAVDNSEKEKAASGILYAILEIISKFFK